MSLSTHHLSSLTHIQGQLSLCLLLLWKHAMNFLQAVYENALLVVRKHGDNLVLLIHLFDVTKIASDQLTNLYKFLRILLHDPVNCDRQ